MGCGGWTRHYQGLGRTLSHDSDGQEALELRPLGFGARGLDGLTFSVDTERNFLIKISTV